MHDDDVKVNVNMSVQTAELTLVFGEFQTIQECVQLLMQGSQ